MELTEFLRQTHAQVKSEIGERLERPDDSYPFPETVFTEVVMQHMAEIGMTFEPEVCHYTARVANARLKISGFALSEEGDQIDLFVSLYSGVDEVTPVPDSETKAAAEQCIRFLAGCANGRLANRMDESSDAYVLAHTIGECYAKLDQIRIYVLTDRKAKSKNFKARDIRGKTIKLEVMDIERLHRHWSEGKPRDELIVDFEKVAGGPLPCVFVPGGAAEYDYALTAIPGEALRFVYEKFGARLLEANVRSFLSATGKVNRGIRDTLRTVPERFMAYNNGIVLVVDELRLGKTLDGGPGIIWLKGMQIVNGGQTTASLYFTKKKEPGIDLGPVRIPAKVIVLHKHDPAAEEALISDISRYANSQNAVRVSDLSANRPFHVEVEKLSLTTYCPDGVGRWFYERAAGSYNVMLMREGNTPARLKQLRAAIPTSRKITKTDLAKFLNAWDQKPDIVSLGAQKNFEQFMKGMTDLEEESGAFLPDSTAYKRMIAKAILFKKTQGLVRPMLQAFQANVTAYVVAVVASRLGHCFDLDRIWLHQGISPELGEQIRTWAQEVNDVLHTTASGRMISEWAKKADCWSAIRDAPISAAAGGIPEVSK